MNTVHLKNAWFSFIAVVLIGTSLSPTFSYAREILEVPASKVLPLLDGSVQHEEWSDAQYYLLDTSRGLLEVWLKHVELEPNKSGQCTIYPENPDHVVACGKQLFMAFRAVEKGVSLLRNVDVYFDEGFDRKFGSGSGDGLLISQQEDVKLFLGHVRACVRGPGNSFEDFIKTEPFLKLEVSDESTCPYCHAHFGKVEGCPEPSCTPWNPHECWRCHPEDIGLCVWSSDPSLHIEALEGARRVPLDGYFYSIAGIFPDWRATSLEDMVHFIAFFREDLGEAEFMIPFVGKEGEPFDQSDLNVQAGDLPGVYFETSVGIYPVGSSKFNSPTWARLRLK